MKILLSLGFIFMTSGNMVLEAKNDKETAVTSSENTAMQEQEGIGLASMYDAEYSDEMEARRRRRRGGGSRGRKGRNPVAPFGIGFHYGGSTGIVGYELSYLVTPQVDIHLAGGVGTSGLIYSVGSRYFFMNNYGSPFFAVNYSRASGLSAAGALTVTNNNAIATYIVNAHSMVLLSGGYRYQWRRLGFMVNMGYGIRMGDDDKILEYLSGDEEGTKSLAKAALLGGFNFGIGISLQIGKYAKKR